MILLLAFGLAGCSREYQRATLITDRSVDDLPVRNAVGGGAQGVRDARLQGYALLYGPMPRGLAVTDNGRVFVSYPRAHQRVEMAVAEVLNSGELRPVPNRTWNTFEPGSKDNPDPRRVLVSAVALTVDSLNRLWILDAGTIDGVTPVSGAAKLVCYDLEEARVVNTIDLRDVTNAGSKLADVQVDASQGDAGAVYVSDAGDGGNSAIIVVDIASGQAWRKLAGHPSVSGERNVSLAVEGELLRPGSRDAVGSGVHGIALGGDNQFLYYAPLAGETLSRVPTDWLRERPGEGNADEEPPVEVVGGESAKSFANVDLTSDARGRIYLGDIEGQAIRRYVPGEEQAGSTLALDLLARDGRLLWPASMAVSQGTLYVLANQENRSPLYGGNDDRDPPYAIFRISLDSDASRSW